MSNKKTLSILALVFAAIVILIKLTTPIDDYFTLEYIKDQHDSIIQYYHSNKAKFIFGYFTIYVALTAVSLPGATLFTLLAGSLFGVLTGTIVASFASSIGATLAFLITRWLLRDYLQKKFPEKFLKINQGIQKEGAFYLFALRMVPIIPFFLVNIGMAITPLRTFTFYIVSQIAMLPATIAFVNAGKEIGKIDSMDSILSPTLIISLAILGILPILSKYFISFIRTKKNSF